MLFTNSRWLMPAAALFTTSTFAANEHNLLQQRDTQTYQIQDSYDATNFFDGFEFFSGPDPTEGFVRYQTALEANDSSLAGFANGGVFLGVDSSSSDVGQPGRASTRVNTKKTYTRGLFVADIAHMPSSTCGVWAAFWSFGDNWPSAGEIDIIEGVNRDTSTSFTLHTSSGCTFQSQGNCNAPGDGTKGCTQPGFNNPLSYGSGFNSIGGGVFATEWTSDAIRMWFFPRTGSIPTDLTSGNPSPANWGTPAAEFSGGGGGSGNCDIDSHFQSHRLVFNTALCGQWAGKVFSQDSQCASLANTCEEFVSQNPAAFKEAYWLINSVKVYSRELGSGTVGSAAAVPATPEPGPGATEAGTGSGPGSDSSQHNAGYASSGSGDASSSYLSSSSSSSSSSYGSGTAPVAVVAPALGSPAEEAAVAVAGAGAGAGEAGGYKTQTAPAAGKKLRRRRGPQKKRKWRRALRWGGGRGRMEAAQE